MREKADRKPYDLSMAFGLLNAASKIAGLSGLCLVAPTLRQNRLKSMQLIIEIRNFADPGSGLLDRIDLESLISFPGDIRLLSLGEYVSGDYSDSGARENDILRFTAFPLLLDSLPALMLLVFYRRETLSADERSLFIEILNVLRHSLILQKERGGIPD